ncbi:hypothetical protein F511_45111 [Dorcoceras hygrometricum]|uniref:Uncharacterized protein n=1 Tax=Dorcoceras hygrometricum TaxID=472368 RepID=A0A2Z7A447_9LAMI|nr:hypothetical protein F511_45111 [Dorcoceras hygrometricum]
MGGAWPRGCCTLADRWSSAGRTKWSTIGSAGRGDARRWMRARLRGDARGRAPACALAARVNSRWRRRRPAAAPTSLRRCRDGWSDFF